MKKILFLFLLISNQLVAQENKKLHFFSASDTLHKKRLTAVSVAHGGIWLSGVVILNKAWYANYPKSSFHLFDDRGEWLQVDKVGHVFSAYWGAQLSTNIFKWAGVKHKNAVLLGAGMGIAFESMIEILDGYSTKWGFSVADMAANTTGSLIFLAQEFAWKKQKIQIKFSAHKKCYPNDELFNRAESLYGSAFHERLLKDYNGQTYWLSANVASFIKHKKIPEWLNLAVGYGASGLYGGYANEWIDENINLHNRNDIPRLRQFYFSPDIDLSKIKINGKPLGIFKILNGIKLKFPLPALEINSNGNIKLHPIYF